MARGSGATRIHDVPGPSTGVPPGVRRPWCDPRMVVKVVVGALVRADRVLLAHRSASRRAFPGVWDLPGGVVEAGESALGALARELREELGVAIAAGSTSHLCRVIARPADGPVELDAWLVTRWSGTPANRAPDEHDAIGWFELAELPPLAHGLVRESLLRALRSDVPAEHD